MNNGLWTELDLAEQELRKVRRLGLAYWQGVYERKVRDLRTILARVGERAETGAAAAVEG